MNGRRFLGALIALAVGFAIPAVAHADTYPSNNPGGWSQSATYEGLCVPMVLCPAVANTYSPTDGPGGGADGYIRTEFNSLVSTLAGTSTGTWEGPAFTYRGNDGVKPTSVKLDLHIRPQIEALLGLTLLNDSSYRVDLIDQSNGVAISAVPLTELTMDAGWTAIPSASIDPKLLKIGRAYRVRITTSYHAVATVVASGEVGYDNVRLTTKGKAGNGGSSIVNVHQLRVLVLNQGLPSSARLVGDTVKIKVKCPGKAAPLKCHYRLKGLSAGKKSKPATVLKHTVIKGGKKKIAKLHVKPRYLAKYKNSDKIWLKVKVRVGKVKVTVRKQVRLVR